MKKTIKVTLPEVITPNMTFYSECIACSWKGKCGDMRLACPQCGMPCIVIPCGSQTE